MDVPMRHAPRNFAERAATAGIADLLAEAADGGGFGVIHVEDRQQLGDLKHFLEFRSEVAQTQAGAL